MSHFREKLRFWLAPEKGRPAKNLLFAFVATTAAIAPDMVMNYAAGTHIISEPLFTLYVFGFMLLLSFCQNRFVYFVIALMVLMQIIQLNFMAFFGHPITAGDIINIVKEKRDVFDAAYLRQTWYVMPLIILFY